MEDRITPRLLAAGLSILLLVAGSGPAAACREEGQDGASVICPVGMEPGAAAPAAAVFGFPVSVPGISKYNSDCRPSLTPDGRLMFFQASRNNGPPYDGVWYGGQGFNIYSARWNGTAWDSVVNVGPGVNQASHPSISAGGDSLLHSKAGIRMSIWNGSSWPAGVLLPSPINVAGASSDAPFLLRDGVTLYFASNRPGGYGGNDIWIGRWNGTAWTVTNAGPGVNTPASETRPAVSPDRTKLYFSDFGGTRRGGVSYGDCDLFVSEWTGSAWGPAVNVGAPINSDLPACSAFPAEDGRLYVSSEVSEGGFGEEDIWVTAPAGAAAGGEPAGEARAPAAAGTGNWVLTGDLAGAWYVYDLVEGAGGSIYAGTAPLGDVFRSTDRGGTWTGTADLPGASRVYSLLAAANGDVYAGTYPAGDVFRSTDGGASWTATADLPGAYGVRSLLQTADGAVLAGVTPDSVGSGRVFRTTNGGATWTRLGPMPSAAGGVFTLFERSGVLFASGRTQDDIYWRSTNGGVTWTIGQLPYPNQAVTIGHLYFFHATQDGRLWTGGWAHGPQGVLFFSANNGASWDTVGTIAQPGDRIVSHVFDLAEAGDGTLYIGTQPGPDIVCMRSTDGGASWAVDGTFTDARELLCLLEVSDGSIYAGTTAGGDIYRLDAEAAGVPDPGASPGVARLRLAVAPNPAGASAEIRFRVPAGAEGEASWVRVFDSRGALVRSFELPGGAGGERTVEWNGRNNAGQAVASGTYFAQVVTAWTRASAKFTLVH